MTLLMNRNKRLFNVLTAGVLAAGMAASLSITGMAEESSVFPLAEDYHTYRYDQLSG